MTSGPEDRLEIERLLPAPVAEVFAAWTDPASMSRWVSPTGRAEVEADVRVGGSFRVAMIGDGERIEHSGEYLRVEPPNVLSFTWISPYTGGPSVVEITLTAVGASTRLRLVHRRLPEDTVVPHRDGWGSILDNLAAELRRSGGER